MAAEKANVVLEVSTILVEAPLPIVAPTAKAKVSSEQSSSCTIS
jgi:hypothetical protein